MTDSSSTRKKATRVSHASPERRRNNTAWRAETLETLRRLESENKEKLERTKSDVGALRQNEFSPASKPATTTTVAEGADSSAGKKRSVSPAEKRSQFPKAKQVAFRSCSVERVKAPVPKPTRSMLAATVHPSVSKPTAASVARAASTRPQTTLGGSNMSSARGPLVASARAAPTTRAASAHRPQTAPSAAFPSSSLHRSLLADKPRPAAPLRDRRSTSPPVQLRSFPKAIARPDLVAPRVPPAPRTTKDLVKASSVPQPPPPAAVKKKTAAPSRPGPTMKPVVSSSRMAAFCTECGQKFIDGAKFCAVCGQKRQSL